jgi:hypothetical protein
VNEEKRNRYGKSAKREEEKKLRKQKNSDEIFEIVP